MAMNDEVPSTSGKKYIFSALSPVVIITVYYVRNLLATGIR